MQTAAQSQSKVFMPGKIGSLELRNRTIRSGCFEGLCPGAAPGEALIEHHRKVAAGGIGMTTVAYCAVSQDGAAFGQEMWMRSEILPALCHLTDAVHREGAAVAISSGTAAFSPTARLSAKPPSAPPASSACSATASADR